MAKVYIFLADGFEEIEGLTPVDILRRGKVEVSTVSIMGRKEINGSHGIKVEADELFEEADFSDGAMLVLPGGLKGTNNLMAHEGLKKLLFEYDAAGKYVCAICAAPSVLGVNGLLKGKKAICYPGFEEKLEGATVIPGAKEVHDGNFVTSRGMGTAMDFSLKLLELMTDAGTAEKIASGVQFI